MRVIGWDVDMNSISPVLRHGLKKQILVQPAEQNWRHHKIDYQIDIEYY